MSNDPAALAVALLVVALLGFVVRWIFKPSRPRTGLIPDAADSSELGLLDVVAVGVPRLAALQLRNRLTDAGIRSSLSRQRNGSVDVLVFRDDAARARGLL